MKEKWVAMQSDKQADLRKKYPKDDAPSNNKYENEYLTWYESVAEAYIEGLNEQRGKILAVFSPNDMKIIEGILDSGSGAELEEARETLENVRKMDPDGGYVYPVSLYPENWFELLDHSFMGTDLLESPAALSESLALKTRQRNNLVFQISQMTAAVPNDTTVTDARTKFLAAQDALDKVSVDIVKQYGEGTKTAFQAVLQIANAVGADNIASAVIARLAGSVENDDNKKKGLMDALKQAISKGIEKQTELVTAGNTLAGEAMKSSLLETLANLKPLIEPLNAQLNTVNSEINDLTAKIKIAQAVMPESAAATAEQPAKISDKDQVTPNMIPSSFTQIVMETATASMDSQADKSASASQSSTGVNLFFAGYSQNEKTSESAYKSFHDDKEMKIQIGFSVAKVTIEREWFNPGVFLLSQDMCNVTTEKFAPPHPDNPYNGFDQNRFNAMNKCLFPCFPTAFVVARDVTIKLVTTNDISDSTSQTIEKHASKGGGFFCFSGSKSSSSSSSTSSVHTQTNSKSITIRFTYPQVLGYYIEATPADMSVYIDDVSKDARAGYVTIIDFVKKCKEMLDDYNKKYGPEKK